MERGRVLYVLTQPVNEEIFYFILINLPRVYSARGALASVILLIVFKWGGGHVIRHSPHIVRRRDVSGRGSCVFHPLLSDILKQISNSERRRRAAHKCSSSKLSSRKHWTFQTKQVTNNNLNYQTWLYSCFIMGRVTEKLWLFTNAMV